MAAKALRWGLLASGNIARQFARALAQTNCKKAAAVASRSLDKAQAFAKEFGIPKAYGRYEELLADPEVEAVYVSTPHPLHAEWAIKAADAGKHILCEKPFTLNGDEARRVGERHHVRARHGAAQPLGGGPRRVRRPEGRGALLRLRGLDPDP